MNGSRTGQTKYTSSKIKDWTGYHYRFKTSPDSDPRAPLPVESLTNSDTRTSLTGEVLN